MDRIDSAIKINLGIWFFCVYSTPDKNFLDLYSGWWIPGWLSSVQWQVLCHRPQRWNWAYQSPHTFLHTSLHLFTTTEFIKIYHKTFFNIQNKKNTFFITTPNHCCAKRIYITTVLHTHLYPEARGSKFFLNSNY
jgi:hypothetical protein